MILFTHQSHTELNIDIYGNLVLGQNVGDEYIEIKIAKQNIKILILELENLSLASLS